MGFEVYDKVGEKDIFGKGVLYREMVYLFVRFWG